MHFSKSILQIPMSSNYFIIFMYLNGFYFELRIDNKLPFNKNNIHIYNTAIIKNITI